MTTKDSTTLQVLLLAGDEVTRGRLADGLQERLGDGVRLDQMSFKECQNARALSLVDPDLIVLDLREEDGQSDGSDLDEYLPLVRGPVDRVGRPLSQRAGIDQVAHLARRVSPRVEWVVLAPEARWPAIRMRLQMPPWRLLAPDEASTEAICDHVDAFRVDLEAVRHSLGQDVYRRLIEDCRDGQLVLDDHGVVLYVNGSAAKSLGLSRDQVVGAHFGWPVATQGMTEITLRTGETAQIRVSETVWRGRTARQVSIREVQVAQSTLRRAVAQIQVSQSASIREAVTDQESGALNRRGLENMLTVERGRARRGGEPCSAVWLFIEPLGGVADKDPGSASWLSRAMVRTLMDETKDGDSVALVAPSTCVVLLPGVRLGLAVEEARRLRGSLSRPRLLDHGVDSALAVNAVPLEVDLARGLPSLLDRARWSMELSAESDQDSDSATFRSLTLPVVNVEDGSVVGHRVSYAIGDLKSWDPRLAFALHELSEDGDYFGWRCFKQSVQRARQMPGELHLDVYPSAVLREGGAAMAEMLADQLNGREVLLRISQALMGSDLLPLAEAIQSVVREGVRLAISDYQHSSDALAAVAVLQPHCVALHEGLLDTLESGHQDAEDLSMIVQPCRMRGIQVIACGGRALAASRQLAAAGVDLAEGPTGGG